MIIEFKLMLKKVLTKDLINGYSIFNGVKCFVENGSLNHVVFQPVFKYFKKPANNNMVVAQKSKVLSNESRNPYMS